MLLRLKHARPTKKTERGVSSKTKRMQTKRTWACGSSYETVDFFDFFDSERARSRRRRADRRDYEKQRLQTTRSCKHRTRERGKQSQVGLRRRRRWRRISSFCVAEKHPDQTAHPTHCASQHPGSQTTCQLKNASAKHIMLKAQVANNSNHITTEKAPKNLCQKKKKQNPKPKARTASRHCIAFHMAQSSHFIISFPLTS
jgi:hypothetical protein